MNDQLQKQLAGLFEKATAAGENIWDFVAGQAPEVIEQLLRWKLVESLLWMFVSFAVLIASIKAITIAVKEMRKGFYEANDALGALSAILGAAGFILSIFGIGSTATTAIQIWIAPKAFLIEYISKL